MNTSNTQDKKTIVSSNFSNFNLLNKDQRIRLNEILKKSDTNISLDNMNPESIENSAEKIVTNFVTETGNDPELSAQSFEVLANLRESNITNNLSPSHLRIMADMIDFGI